jgi:hypothetical protein
MQQQVQVSLSCHQSQFPINPNPDLHQKKKLVSNDAISSRTAESRKIHQQRTEQAFKQIKTYSISKLAVCY